MNRGWGDLQLRQRRQPALPRRGGAPWSALMAGMAGAGLPGHGGDRGPPRRDRGARRGALPVPAGLPGRGREPRSCCSMRCCRSRRGGFRTTCGSRASPRRSRPASCRCSRRAPVVGFAQNLSGGGDVAPVPDPVLPDRAARPAFLPRHRGAQPRRPSSHPAAPTHRPPSGSSPTAWNFRELDEQLFGSGEHILFLGRVQIWEKGLDLLLAAYARSGLDMPLLIAGAGTRGEERSWQRCSPRHGARARWLGQVGWRAQGRTAGPQRLRGDAVTL